MTNKVDDLITTWREDLIWCPSQIDREVIDDKGEIYTIYMRWRGGDPWQFYLIKGRANNTNTKWHSISSAPHFMKLEYNEGEEWFLDWWENNKNNLSQLTFE